MGSNKKSDGADDDEIAVTQNFAFWNNSAASHLASVALSVATILGEKEFAPRATPREQPK